MKKISKSSTMITKAEFPVSLTAYGDGPLQLSTDKSFHMFPRLEQEGDDIIDQANVQKILNDPAFMKFRNINILPLIYNDKESAMQHSVARLQSGNGRDR